MLVGYYVFNIPMSWGYFMTSIINGLAMLNNILETKVVTGTNHFFHFKMFVNVFKKIKHEIFMRSSNNLLLNNVGRVLNAFENLD